MVVGAKRDPEYVITGENLGEALHEALGEHWKLRLNAATGISARQLWRWQHSMEPLPRYMVCLARLIRGEKHIGIDGDEE